jgi:hypothetical protein
LSPSACSAAFQRFFCSFGVTLHKSLASDTPFEEKLRSKHIIADQRGNSVAALRGFHGKQFNFSDNFSA